MPHFFALFLANFIPFIRSFEKPYHLFVIWKGSPLFMAEMRTVNLGYVRKLINDCILF
uniref:Uncharacterized protein n=1 Tax=Meloidogyne incognita TaxID=6306 RepID=A0A914LDH8_MELIC